MTSVYELRARRTRRWLVVGLVVAIATGIIARELRPQPGVLDVSSIPVATAALGHALTVGNPLEPTLGRATVESVHGTGSLVTATIRVCPRGTWQPNGVVGFVAQVHGADALLPLQSSPLLEVVATQCTTSTLTFEALRPSTVTGIAYVAVPYVHAVWTLQHALRVATKVRAP